MKYRRLGKSGLQVSELSFAWVTFAQQIGSRMAEKLMTIAYDAGVNFFDNAEAYADGKAEIVMGDILKRRLVRDTFVVSSKVFWGGDLPIRKASAARRDRSVSRRAAPAAGRLSRSLFLPSTGSRYADRRNGARDERSYYTRQSPLLGDIGVERFVGLEAHGIARDLRLVPPTMEQPQYNMFHRDNMEQKFAPLYRKMGLGQPHDRHLPPDCSAANTIRAIPVAPVSRYRITNGCGNDFRR